MIWLSAELLEAPSANQSPPRTTAKHATDITRGVAIEPQFFPLTFPDCFRLRKTIAVSYRLMDKNQARITILLLMGITDD
ncbi:MAG: hypothetical protein IID46_14545 [Planctomycetes bacterium]|nr:hypothetical protein [Planctomycetota bacterium]